VPFAFICKKYNSAGGKFGSRTELDCREISPILYANVKRCKVMCMREVRNLHALKCMNLCNLNSYLSSPSHNASPNGRKSGMHFYANNGLFDELSACLRDAATARSFIFHRPTLRYACATVDIKRGLIAAAAEPIRWAGS
jgi:hypothetical protein